ncbi:hypothetical protein GQ44DRAFT_726624 [Phaeosphaeriaceae sp. PMI808]|nr:hypothetical protein GQ44DRAFT_726624 [Phaeosphaeriaceae sp. PMI808]
MPNITTEDDVRSVRSNKNSLCLDEDDRQYPEGLKDRGQIVTKNTRNPLGTFTVIAFILQQVIGIGIFRTPCTVIHATQSVGATLLLWSFGALSAMAGTVIYVEFGLSIPRHLIDGKKEPVVRNGGDLNYVNYLVKRPKYFVLSIYAVTYIFVSSSAANALSFGDHIIGDQDTDRGAGRDAAARGLAILTVTFPCFLHAFTRRGGILLNNIVAMIKVSILCAFPIIAICVSFGVVDSNPARSNLNLKNSFANAHATIDSYT